MESLSKRGQKLASGSSRVDMDLFFDAMQDPYDLLDNPGGKIALNIAENAPMTEAILTKVQSIIRDHDLPSWISNYTHTCGHPDVTDKVAAFMQKYFHSDDINGQNVVLSAGASAALEVLSFVLADQDDVVCIPAPSYPMYTVDLGVKSGMLRHNIQTHFDIENLHDLAIVNLSHLRATLAELQKNNRKLRMLLLTSPDNPTGSVYDQKELTYMAEWCHQHHIHLVVNEIYHLSRVGETVEMDKIPSFAEVMSALKSPYLHLIYGMSKDFAMSGMRVGIIHSLNKDVIAALSNVNIPHMVSNITQYAVGELLCDERFIENYLLEHNRILTKHYNIVAQALASMKIPFIPSAGSLFVWADFSRYLRNDTAQAEYHFWSELYERTGVLLTPGEGFGHEKHGLFRIVFSAVEEAGLKVAMHRVERYLNELN